MITINDLKVGNPFPPNGRVYYISEIGDYRRLSIERPDGSSYTAYLHKDTPLADAYGGGSYKHDAHLQ